MEQLKIYLSTAKEDDPLVKKLAPKPELGKPVYKNWFRKELEAKGRLHSH